MRLGSENIPFNETSFSTNYNSEQQVVISVEPPYVDMIRAENL